MLTLPLMPPEASTMASRVDVLFFALVVLTGAIALLVATLIIVFSIRYRRRSPDEIPVQDQQAKKLEITWTVIPVIAGFVLFTWAARLYMQQSYPPKNAMDVYVVAKQWMWKVQYPGGQHEINEMHVPLGRPVKLTMISQDVIHGFYVPAFRMKADVRPGRYSVTWFQATKLGRYHLFCSQYCGTSHADMEGWVTVMSPADFQRWLEERPTGSLSSQGEKLFLQLGCGSCHRADELRSGPVLEGIYGTNVRLSDGSMVRADENYIRESILVPGAKLVRGYQNIMPSFQGRLTEEQMQQLVAYVRSLEPLGPGLGPAGTSPAIPGTLSVVPPVALPGGDTIPSEREGKR